jgi:hypothetical protein
MPGIGHVAIGLAARKISARGAPAKWSSVPAMIVWSGLSLAGATLAPTQYNHLCTEI